MMSTYRERRLAKAERLRTWADGREAKGDAALRRAEEISDGIPMGQPILVGHHSERRHRKDLERIQSGMHAAVENSGKATEYRNRADNIEAAADNAIYSDDPDAIEQLQKRIAELEAERERIKAYNKTVKAGHPDPQMLDAKQRRDLASVMRTSPYQCPGGKFPSYGLTNLSGNINRNKKRLEALVAAATRPERVQRRFTARFDSTCAECGGTIEKGTEGTIKTSKGRVVHPDCFEDGCVR